MKQKKLHIDARPGKQPDGTYPFAKNGIQNDVNDTPFNEPGFTKLVSALLPVGHILMGVIETDSKPVIFSTDNTNSAISYFDTAAGTLTTVVNDDPANLVNWPATGEKLDFDTSFYITGQSQRNYKGELITVFTDKNEFPKYLNCDAPSINRLDDTRLFPINLPPTINSIEQLGGSLLPGAYYVSISYEKNDGTATQRSEVSNGITISPGDFGISTDKAILITVTNADINYDFMRVTIISKVKGITKAVEITDPIPVISGTVQFLYTGDNLSTDVDLTEVLTPAVIYSKVQCMGQLNDALYLGGLDKEPEINDMQPYANMVTLQWKSELLNALSPIPDHINGIKKSFMHEEVYAFYIRYRKTRGGFTKAFTIPGPVPLAGDLVFSTEASTGGGSGSIPKFKVEDTIHSFNAGTFSGECGVWQNGTERYPNTIDFDSTSLGGPNLRNELVLHHKMPTLRWCKANLYSSNSDYGKTHLDILGITPANIAIPAKYTGILDGYQILYAKRTVTNQTVYGQSLLMHGAVDALSGGVPTNIANIYTTGGNWTASVWHNGKGDYNDDWELSSLRKDTMRFHAFDMLFNKPTITPSFISSQFKVRRGNLENEGYLEDGSDNNTTMPIVHLIDYTLGDIPVAATPSKLLRAIDKNFYLTNGINVNQFVNSRHEGCLGATLLGSDWGLSYDDSGIRIRGQSFTEPAVGSPGFEESYLINLIAVKSDLYSNFYSQRLVSTADSRSLGTLDTAWGGDTFVGDYTFHTYGRHDIIDTFGSGFCGIKAIRRFVCESASNIHLRYEIAGNEYSKWYPHTPVAPNNPNECYITLFERTKDPNQFGYSRDFNALNDFISSTVFNPFQEEITHFPYRIHRTGKLSRQARPRNWRTVLPLDYYECQKNMGFIVNLEGMDDRLIIHHENALFRTQDKAKLETDNLSVTLGTGDIFQFEPQAAEDSKLGYAGTQHDLACLKSPIGYIFVDAKQGSMYIMKKQLVNLNTGVNTFLRDALNVPGKNVYTGNGITIGWDQVYERILLTVKNKYIVGDNEVDNSFTMSYSTAGGGWTFFHDYIPDKYIHTREELFTAKYNTFYKHNSGPAGLYHDPAKYPFFIDVVFPADSEILLETVNWVSDYLTNVTDQSFKTITHISIWNSHQHSGRIDIRAYDLPLILNEKRRTQGEWCFNDFRNILVNKNVKFLMDIFNNFQLDPAQADPNLPWYYKELLQDQWFCVRFEFDNQEDSTIFLHEVNIHATKSTR